MIAICENSSLLLLFITGTSLLQANFSDRKLETEGDTTALTDASFTAVELDLEPGLVVSMTKQAYYI